MKTYIFLFVCLLSGTYIYAINNTENQIDEENVTPVATPMSTPIFVGKSLYCPLHDYDCGTDMNRPIVQTSCVEDTIQVIVQYRVNFDVTGAEKNKELPVRDINGLQCIKCNVPSDIICELASKIREEMLKWHWWIGDYYNPCTLSPSQIWTTRFLVVPEVVNNDK
jgi:hypothetical protein